MGGARESAVRREKGRKEMEKKVTAMGGNNEDCEIVCACACVSR